MAQISTTTIILIITALSVICTDASALSCCRKYSKAVIRYMAVIKGYSIQTIKGKCNINAVIFHTNGGRNICTDPSKIWVMDNIRKLRDKVQAIRKKHSKV
ncbi:C-C motif chemokine 20a.3 [Xyrauchen texanus]|uniref:C-C motif chemokine 20a.3 n=1 Tax=Xyrauchen texanus TaxID=154827 RepID=UPI0022422CCC|nr:C-C motif chemokine 20a.3 [Xyrauchen texanus]